MSYSYRLIVLSCLLSSFSAHALTASLDALYWQAVEPIDWVYINNLQTPNQNLTYKSIHFSYAPGFRVGMGNKGAWDTDLYYTRYYKKTNSTAGGNLTSSFMGGKLLAVALGAGYFFRAGQVSLTLNYNMFDFDLSKTYKISNKLSITPIVGLKGGWIYQTIDESLQGTTSSNEVITNDFVGLGPKLGVDTKLALLSKREHTMSLVADFAFASMWGKWFIKDNLYATGPRNYNINVANRDLAALAFQGLVGVNYDYKNLSVTLGYEINDYLNHLQIFDDDTGTHNNDLYLQGVTLGFTYDFGC